MARRIGWVVAILALMGLFMGGCGWKKKAQIAACNCMVECVDQLEVDTPQEMMKCQKQCRGKHSEGWDQGSQIAMEVLDGERDDCNF